MYFYLHFLIYISTKHTKQSGFPDKHSNRSFFTRARLKTLLLTFLCTGLRLLMRRYKSWNMYQITRKTRENIYWRFISITKVLRLYFSCSRKLFRGCEMVNGWKGSWLLMECKLVVKYTVLVNELVLWQVIGSTDHEYDFDFRSFFLPACITLFPSVITVYAQNTDSGHNLMQITLKNASLSSIELEKSSN